MESKTEGTMWKSIKNCVRNWCQKWPCILFGANYRENKQCCPSDTLTKIWCISLNCCSFHKYHPFCPLAVAHWISPLTFFNRQNLLKSYLGLFRATEVVSLNNASPCYLPTKLTTVEADIHRLKSVTTTSRSNFSDLCTFQRGKSRQSCPQQLSVTHQLRQVCSFSCKAVFKMFNTHIPIEFQSMIWVINFLISWRA